MVEQLCGTTPLASSWHRNARGSTRARIATWPHSFVNALETKHAHRILVSIEITEKSHAATFGLLGDHGYGGTSASRRGTSFKLHSRQRYGSRCHRRSSRAGRCSHGLVQGWIGG